MDFKISDTNKGKKSLSYDGFIYRIDGVLKCGDISCSNFHLPVGEQGATDVEFNAWRTEAL